MTYTYNITFVIAHEQCHHFLGWLEGEAVPALFEDDRKSHDIRVQTVVEAGGEKPGPEHGLSIALQADFKTEKEARDWQESKLPIALNDYRMKFGQHALFFITLLACETL